MANDTVTTENCEHPAESIHWPSGEAGVYISLNGPVIATCTACGYEAHIDDNEEMYS